MRLMSLSMLFGIAASGLAAADAPPALWKLDARTRAERRADPTLNASRQAAWAASGRSVQAGDNVVDGSIDPAILAPIELVDQVIPVFNLERAQQERFRRQWATRGATQLLGRDFWDRLHVVLAPAIALDRENRRLGALSAAEHDQAMQSRRNEQFSDGGECAARADALAAARGIWGEAFDRFLYEVVAPGVSFTSSCSDPALMAKPDFWIAEWRAMEEGCR